MKQTLIYLILFVIMLTGYIKNIIKLSECDFKAPYKTEVIRIVGIPAGFGFIIGYITIGEENKKGDKQ